MNKIQSPNKVCPPSMRLAAFLALLTTMSGCAEHFDMDNELQWYSASVVRISTLQALGDSVNQRCVTPLAPTPTQFAVVKIRIHRALQTLAFAVSPSLNIQEGDRVSVNPKLCQLRMPKSQLPVQKSVND